MRLTDTQKNILRNTTAVQKTTPAVLATNIGSLPGPIARSGHSLVEKGLLITGETKEGETFFKRTAEGGKIAKKL